MFIIYEKHPYCFIINYRLNFSKPFRIRKFVDLIAKCANLLKNRAERSQKDFEIAKKVEKNLEKQKLQNRQRLYRVR